MCEHLHVSQVVNNAAIPLSCYRLLLFPTLSLRLISELCMVFNVYL